MRLHSENALYVDATPSTEEVDASSEVCELHDLDLPRLTWCETAGVSAVVLLASAGGLLVCLMTPLFIVAPFVAMFMLVICPFVISQSWRLLKQSHVLQPEVGLATPSSHFTKSSCHSHVLHSICHCEGRAHDAPIVCCHFSHGFAANCLTWEPFFPLFAQALSRASTKLVLVAHDRPGFGLTSRPTHLDAYSESTCTDLAVDLVEQTMAAARRHEDADPSEGLVLIGHSLGCAQSVRMALRRPHAVRALVLLAPALMPCPRGCLPEAPPLLRRALRMCAGAGLGITLCSSRLVLVPLAGLIARGLSVALRLVLFYCLHSALFWRTMLAHAYADERKLTSGMEWRYRWVTRVRGADAATVRYLAALARQQLYNLWPDQSGSDAQARGDSAARCASGGASSAPLRDDESLWRELAMARLPVLIVHGRRDRVIPTWNSRRLAASMPSAHLVELDACGHNVHEECPEQLAACVAEFLKARASWARAPRGGSS